MSSIQPEPAGAALARPWPADRVERWPIERLIPYTNHARLHTEVDVDKLAAGIRQWGWTLPVLVDEAGNVLAGALRVRAAIRLGITEIPVIVARAWNDAHIAWPTISWRRAQPGTSSGSPRNSGSSILPVSISR